MLAHADRRVQRARGDTGEESTPLLLASVGEKTGCHLAVGDPVRGHRCTLGQQLLGHHVAMQVPQSVPAVLGRDGEADEPGFGQPRGEGRVPFREPGIDRGFPAVGRAIRGHEVPDRRTQLAQLAVVGAQGFEFAH